MADPRFFECAGPFSLSDIADAIGAELAEGVDGTQQVDDVAALDGAGANTISFFDNIKYKDQFIATNAGACIVHPSMQGLAPKGCALLLSKSVYKSYALAAQMFYPEEAADGYIHEKAYVSSGAKIGDGVRVDAMAVICDGAVIGDNSWIEAGAHIGESVEIGSNCRIGVNSTITHTIIGDYTRIYTGTRIGQDGFGFAPDPAGFVKVPQLGRVMIGSHVEIGANTTIDRGAGPDTVIGDGTWIDNLVQIGHNVKTGRGCVIVAQVGISGSTVVGDFVMMGGQAGVAGHLEIGSGARIAAQSGVMRSIPAGDEQMGSPAMPSKQFMRQVAALKRLITNKKQA